MSLPARAFYLIRHDFGRKLTALGLALGVWFVLESVVLADLPDLLAKVEIRFVPSVEAADIVRAQTSQPAVYLIVPENLILMSCKPEKLRLTVKGLKKDVEGLVLSAYVQLTEADLAGKDENTFTRTLNRESFKSRGDPPDLTLFRIGHESTADLTITLARRATLNVALGPANVQVTGQAAKDFVADTKLASVVPNVLDVSGPSRVIERFRADPSALKLAPVVVDGRSAAVSQVVGLADLPDNGLVLLGSRDNKVQVTVPVVPEPGEVVLRAIPINYLHQESALKSRRMRLVDQPPESLDVLVRGPKSELGAFPPDQLAQRVYQFFDFNSPDLVPGINHPHLKGFVDGLSDAVRVYGVDNRDEAPLIQFKVELVPEGP